MQCHFCLELSDPLILRGTLFPCDVKTPELEMLFLISFQKLKTLFRAELDTLAEVNYHLSHRACL